MSDEEEESLDDEAWREYPIWLQVRNVHGVTVVCCCR
jgi:hypothetical protein